MNIKEIDDPVELNLTKASWLQKCIRRGLVDKSVAISKLYIEMGQSKGLSRRLQIIATEDIGVATPQLLILMKGEPDLIKQTVMLCSAWKNRECDRFLAYTREKSNKITKESKILTLLLHAAGNWKKNRRIAKHKQILDSLISKMMNNKSKFQSELIEIAYDNFISQTRHNVHGSNTSLAFIALIFTRDFTVREFELLKYNEIELGEVDDFAIDGHTPEGKKKGRGFDFWLQNGCIVFPEVLYPSLYLKSGKEKYPLKGK